MEERVYVGLIVAIPVLIALAVGATVWVWAAQRHDFHTKIRLTGCIAGGAGTVGVLVTAFVIALQGYTRAHEDNIRARDFAHEELGKDYVEHKVATGTAASYDVWYSRYRYPNGLTPSNEKEQLERGAKGRLKELRRDATAAAVTLDEHILRRFNGDWSKAFRTWRDEVDEDDLPPVMRPFTHD